MEHTDEEIVSFAKSQIRFIDQQKGKRLVFGFMGVGGMVVVILLAAMLLEKSEKVGGLFQDEIFLLGVAFGILAVLALGISVLGFLRMFSMLHGKDIGVYRLLVKWHEEKNG